MEAVAKLDKAAIQPMVDAVADCIPTWKGGIVNSGGRLLLTKVTFSSIPICTSIALALPPWTLKAIDKFLHAFVWTGSEVVSSSLGKE